MPDPLVDVIAEALPKMVPGATLRGVYAESIAAAIRSRLLADDVVEAAAGSMRNTWPRPPYLIDARAALTAALDAAEGTPDGS